MPDNEKGRGADNSFSSKLTRRDFLKELGITAAAVAAEIALAGCGRPTPTKEKPLTGAGIVQPPEPTATPTFEPTVTSTPTKEPSPTLTPPKEPWSGSLKILVMQEVLGVGGGTPVETVAVGTLTPESALRIEAIRKTAQAGKIITASGSPFIVKGREAIAGQIVNVGSYTDTEKEWQYVLLENLEGVLLPANYLRENNQPEEILVYVVPPQGQALDASPNWGIIFKEGKNELTIFARGQIPDIKEGKPIRIEPERFIPTFEISPASLEPSQFKLPYFLEKEEADGTTKYLAKEWNSNPDPATKKQIAPLPKVEALAQTVDQNFIQAKVENNGIVWVPTKDKLYPKGNLHPRGDWRKVSLIETPAELRKILEATEAAKVERPAWVVPVSNTEARYNQEKKVWEYYSTAEGEKGQYVVSVKQKEGGGNEFFSFTEDLRPNLHPEVLSQSSMDQIAERMKATGAVKYLFFDTAKVERLEVQRYPQAGNIPAGLKIYIRQYPIDVYYPFIKDGQIGTGISKQQLYFDGVNEDILRSIGLKAYDVQWQTRIIDDSENLVGQSVLSSLGKIILKVKSGYLKLLGRQEYEDGYNRMLLDSFVRDANGRLMHP